MSEDSHRSEGSYSESGSPFINRGLFSDHFLESRLPQWDDWKDDGGFASFRAQVLNLYQSKQAILPTLNEAQTENEFIQPMLDILGWTDSYIVQAPTKIGKQTGRPDYALFPDATAKNAAYDKLKSHDYSRCLGIADAKYWDRELDLSKVSNRDTFTKQNPSFQIFNYLTGTQQKWGILTNGRLWRLYCRSHLPMGDFYQVDLIRLLFAADDSLKYCWLLFQKQAFLPGIDGRSFLDKVLEGSIEYASELEADVKERAYEVVQLLCRGFAASFAPGSMSDDKLKEIYSNSLVLLYRLLFVLYAEARELLPLTGNQSYRDNYSMRKITQDIDAVVAKGQQLSSQSSKSYQSVRSLFQLIDKGDAGLQVPEYNGGLFDPQEHPFLEQHLVADSYLVPAIHQLTRVLDRKLGRQVVVDYNTLTERHLGSIYEGLLEFRPRMASTDLVAVKEKDATRYAPAKEHPGKSIAFRKGELYLTNDKGERKSTGSYYTPEHIVDHIVENCLDPLVKRASATVKMLKDDVNAKITSWQKLKEQKQGNEPVEKYDKCIAEERERLLRPYLSISVLDPSMGSGHFLIKATKFLAEAIATDPFVEPQTQLDEESELAYYRRRVVESCIYGVDINPLAVELAKLTLWLGTMAKSKPLSFLNHHLRVGNSLVGARAAALDDLPKIGTNRRKKSLFDLDRAPAQLGLFAGAFNKKLCVLLQSRSLIAQLPTKSLDDVRRKEEWEKDFDRTVERFRTLSHVWTSTYFGNKVPWDQYNSLLENLQSTQPVWDEKAEVQCVRKAVAEAKERHFFHWELEFPEIFYDAQGNRKADPGFDAVVGNPPYDVIAEKEQEVDVEADKEFYKDSPCLIPAIGGKLNYYRLFTALSIDLVRKGGTHGFIVPMALIGDAQAEPLRRYILDRTQLLMVDAFPQKDDPNNRVFQDAKLSTCTYLTSRTEPTGPFSLRIHAGKDLEPATPRVDITRDDLELLNPQGLSIPSAPGTTAKHIAMAIKMAKRCSGHKFGHIASSQQGEVNLTTHKGLLSESPDGPEVLRGAHVNRYEFNNKPKQGTPVYLNVEKFLEGRRHASKAFDHKERRIGYQRGSAIDNWRRIIACAIDPGNFCSDTVNYIVRPEADFHFVLALLNSSLFEWRFRLTSTNNHVNSYEIDALPLRNINWTTPEDERQNLVSKGKELYAKYLETGNPAPIVIFVRQRLAAAKAGGADTTRDQSDVVSELISFLGQEMLRLNCEKQHAVDHFLTWLENEILKSTVEDQKNKTKLRDFHQGILEDLLDVLKKNGVIQDPCPSKMRDALAAEFDAAMNFLLPLKSQIEATDPLIDQVVYQLYDLEGDEIAIVEEIRGRTSPAIGTE